jgi:hypothetical protein
MVCFTLERFLASKDYRKDAEGVEKLTDVEVMAIQNGVANYRYLDKLSFSDRLYEILWEFEDYRRNGNPSGHSVVQRFEYWKAALNIIKENIILGVGTGDVATAYKEQYEKNEITARRTLSQEGTQSVPHHCCYIWCCRFCLVYSFLFFIL